MQKRILIALVIAALGYATALDAHMWVTATGVAEQAVRAAGRYLSKA